MKQRSVLLSRKALCIALGAAAILMILGSFIDYPLSCALYNEKNPIAMFFAAYGEIPATLGWVAAGVLLVCGRNKEKKLPGVLQCAGGVLLAALGTLMVCFMPAIYLPISPAILALLGLVLSAGTVIVAARLARGADRQTVLLVAAALFFAIFLELMAVNCIKIPWGRARMRLVANDPRAHFMPWWQAGGTLKATLTAAGVAAEEFKSFPSGHTANAATMLLLGLIPQLKPDWEKYKRHFLAAGFVWTAVVAFTRIVMGAHYLTDTTVGFTVGLLCVYGVCAAVFGKEHAPAATAGHK